MPNAKNLVAAKKEVSRKYLGNHGIHGVGMRIAEDAVSLHVDPSFDLGGGRLLAEIRSLAHPHRIVIVEEEGASVSSI